MDDTSDQALVQAIRKRLLEEIAAKQQDKIVNNIYGGQASGPGPGGAGGGGLMDRLGGEGQGPGNPEDNSYFVDILRENMDPGDETMVQDPETGHMVPKKLLRGGWQKRVHRFSQPKKKVMAPP